MTLQFGIKNLNKKTLRTPVQWVPITGFPGCYSTNPLLILDFWPLLWPWLRSLPPVLWTSACFLTKPQFSSLVSWPIASFLVRTSPILEPQGPWHCMVRERRKAELFLHCTAQRKHGNGIWGFWSLSWAEQHQKTSLFSFFITYKGEFTYAFLWIQWECWIRCNCIESGSITLCLVQMHLISQYRSNCEY